MNNSTKSSPNNNIIEPLKRPMTQMALDLPVKRSYALEDLAISVANQLAVDLVSSWPDWPGNLVIMAGPIGSGKSHLATAWAMKSNAQILQLCDLDQDTIQQYQLEFESAKPLLLEDAGKMEIDEVSLFHLLNVKKSTNASVLITSRKWPGEWGIKLADLNSRLRAAQLVELGEPDDILLNQVLVKHFSDHQLPVEPGVIDYLVQRMERSLEAANLIVSKLDELSLQRKTKITRKLAIQVLQIMDEPEGNLPQEKIK